MITSRELSSIIKGDSILYTCTQIYTDIINQGYSKFHCENEYDFFRLVEQFEWDGYNVEHDLETFFINITQDVNR